MVLLLLFSFLSGLVTILAPCIWPLLPIILSTSALSKGHQKPLGITLGITISFAVFTLAVSSLVRLFHFDPNFLRIVAVIVIGFLGLTMLIPKLSEFTEILFSRLTGFLGQNNFSKGNGFGSGFITGLSLGIVWSPCAGPILAAIAALAATGKVTFDVILITLAYVSGVGIPLFIFAYGGQTIFSKTKFISSKTGTIQKIFGIIMLLTALLIYTNYDQYLQTKLLDIFPAFSQTLNKFESNSAITNQLNVIKGNQPGNVSQSDTNGLFNTDSTAPDFIGIDKWLNTGNAIKISDLRGKVVLVDFWTYTCINCIRTLPHVTSWYDKYKNQGFVVIGVHTPEFAFEHDTGNVGNAIKMYNIHYPVAQDNNYATWNNYNNQYWPAEYLIDATGNVRRTHFGEGEYDQTEMAIQALLKEAGKKVTSKLEKMPDQTPSGQISPETYVGAKRMQYYYQGENTGTVSQNFKLSENLSDDSFSFGGNWNITDEEATAGKNAVLNYNFSADKVFLVLRPNFSKNGKIKVFIDGKPTDNSNAGSDVVGGQIQIDQDRLYNLIDLKNHSGRHILKLEFDSGISAFAFTFG